MGTKIKYQICELATFVALSFGVGTTSRMWDMDTGTWPRLLASAFATLCFYWAMELNRWCAAHRDSVSAPAVAEGEKGAGK